MHSADVSSIPDEWFYIAAKAIASSVLPKELEVDCVLPGNTRIQQLSLDVAAAILGSPREVDLQKFRETKAAISKRLYSPT